jgi:hypothetical protein
VFRAIPFAARRPFLLHCAAPTVRLRRQRPNGAANNPARQP